MVDYIDHMGLDINDFRATGCDYERDDFEIGGNYPGIMYYGETILSFAAVAQQSHIVKYLLEHGANPGVCDKNGKRHCVNNSTTTNFFLFRKQYSAHAMLLRKS